MGGARLEAIESTVSQAGSDVVESVAGLVDKSLLRRRDDADGLPRFSMLSTIREHAITQLVDEGDNESAASRHAAYFLHFVEEAGQQIQTREQLYWLRRLEADQDNLRAAFDHLLLHQPSLALQMAAALGWFWDIRGQRSEGRDRLSRAMATTPMEGVSAAKASFFAGRLAYYQGDPGPAEQLLSEALQIARHARDTRVEVLALTQLGLLAMTSNRPERSVELDEQALAIARAENDPWTICTALNRLGDVLNHLGRPRRARPLLEESIELGRVIDVPMAIVAASGNLASLMVEDGDLEAAEPLISECLRTADEIGWRGIFAQALGYDAFVALHRGELDRAETRIRESAALLRISYRVHAVTVLLGASSILAAARDNPVRAATLWGAFDTAMQALGLNHMLGERRLREQWLPKARSATDPAAWEAAWKDGARLNREQLLDLVVAGT